MIHIPSLLPLNQLFKRKGAKLNMSISGYKPGEVNKVAMRRNRSPSDFNSCCGGGGEAEGAAALS